MLVLNLQVNPLAETDDGKLIAADAKLGFDDNAGFRQKEIFGMRDASQEDPRCGTYTAMPHNCISCRLDHSSQCTRCQHGFHCL